MGERKEVDYETEEVRRTMLVCDNCNADIGFEEDGASLKDVYFNPQFSISTSLSHMREHAKKDWRSIGSMKFEYDGLRRALDSFPSKISYDGKEGWCEKCFEHRDMECGSEEFANGKKKTFFSSLSQDSKIVIFGSAIIVSFFGFVIGIAVHPIISGIFLLITIALAVVAIELI